MFSARGQIWSADKFGGTATLLTTGPGQHLLPRCSPDGKWIAYSLNVGQGGERDVYVMPSAGGEPRRLTFRSDFANWVQTWTPDSASVVFLSNRMDWNGMRQRAFTVPVEGGLAVPLPLEKSGDLSYSPDGKSIAYTRFFTDFAAWKRYNGGQAPKVFTFDLQTHEQKQITNWKGTDTAPMCVADKIYFLSDRDDQRRANIWVYDIPSKKTRPVTHFSDYDIEAPSFGSSTITFSQAGRLWAIDLPSETLRPVDVMIPDDGSRTAPRTVPVADMLREQDTDYDVDYDLSPDGNTAVLAARGDIFLAPAKGVGQQQDLTSTSNAEEDHPTWSPDGHSVAYTTDVSGEQQLAVRTIASNSERILTNFKTGFLFKPVWSPDGKWIAIHDGAHHLWLVETQSGNVQLVAYNEFHYMHETNEHDATFSPDSQWLAFSTSRSTRLRALHLYEISSAKDTIVSSPMESDYRPGFSPDGRFIFFVSDRNILPVHADLETNAIAIKSGGIYAASLSSSEPPLLQPYQADVPKDDASTSDHAASEHQANAADTSSVRSAANPEILLSRPDLSGLMARAVALPIQPADIESLDVRTGNVFYRTAAPSLIEGHLPGEPSELRSYDFIHRHDFLVASGVSSAAISRDGTRTLFVKEGDWNIADATADAPNAEKLSTEGLRATIDPVQEWTEMFENSWRLERDLYVNADMNGVNWDLVHDRYARLLPLVADRSDLNYLVGQIIGEIGGSHLRVGGGDDGSHPTSPRTGLLGADYVLDPSTGRYRFAKIYSGDNTREAFRSPLTWPGVGVKVGDYLMAINGHDLLPPNDPDRMLWGVEGAVTLSIATSPTGQVREVKVQPVFDDTLLRQQDHFDHARAEVDRLSNGRIAYIGLPDMIAKGMEQFVRQYYAQLDKEAVIIDDRNNPGGNTDEIILERFRRVLSGMQTERDRVAQTQPDQILVGPKAMLIDGNSSSDGEVFPLHFRAYGLGTLIGTRTWGGVRGLRTLWTLLDNGTIIIPEITFYDAHSHWSVENYGVVPDMDVDDSPNDHLLDRDPPLETAVQVLLKKIGSKPHRLPQPPVSPPDYPPGGNALPNEAVQRAGMGASFTN